MDDYRYDAETNSFVERTAVAAKPQPTVAPSSQPLTKTPLVSKAERKETLERARYAARISQIMAQAAAGDVVEHGASYFKKSDIEELATWNQRLATDQDRHFEITMMEDVHGHLREVRICPVESDTANAEPAQIVVASTSKPRDQAQSPAASTTPRPLRVAARAPVQP